MKTVAITEFKAQCLALLEDVATTGEPLVVTKRGKPLARVIPSGVTATYPQDTLAGTVEILGDVLAPAVHPDDWNATRGVLLTQEDAPPRARKSRRSRR